MAVLLTAILYSAKKNGFQILPEIADTSLERNGSAIPEMPADPSRDTKDWNSTKQSRPNDTFAEADEIRLIDQKELNRLQMELAFIEWAVRAEE
jgi:hypothetical protein